MKLLMAATTYKNEGVRMVARPATPLVHSNALKGAVKRHNLDKLGVAEHNEQYIQKRLLADRKAHGVRASGIKPSPGLLSRLLRRVAGPKK